MQFYWSILIQIVTEVELEPIKRPLKKETIEKTEVHIEMASRSQSRASNTSQKSTNIILHVEHSKGFYPIMASAPAKDNYLDPIDTQSLEDEAAGYDHGQYPPLSASPPYNADHVPVLPKVLLHQTTTSNLEKQKIELEAQLQKLKEIKKIRRTNCPASGYK